MTVLGYLPKLNRGLRLALGAYFLHDFSMYSLLNTPAIGHVSMSYVCSFLRDQRKCVIKFLFKQLMMS